MDNFKPARYSKGNIAFTPPGSHNWRSRESRLATTKGVRGRYSRREKAYIMSPSQAERLKTYISQGYDSNPVTDELILPETLKSNIS